MKVQLYLQSSTPRIAGLIAKSLQEFKLQFEASFPKDDMAKAIAAANCTIVDGKVVFIGG